MCLVVCYVVHMFWCVCVYVCLYMYMCVCVCIHARANAGVFLFVCVFVRAFILLGVCVFNIAVRYVVMRSFMHACGYPCGRAGLR